MIDDALRRLDAYCKKCQYQGWDLFDGLNSIIFHKLHFYKFRIFRLAWVQLFKRSPINFRSITRVPKGDNPKGLSLFASGLIAQSRLSEAKILLDKLSRMQCRGFKGASWGYNFPWQARAFFVPVGTPNIITTVFVVNAFLDYYDRTGDTEFLYLAEKTSDFILNHMILFEESNRLCFAYIPETEARVHNVNMLSAALLARIYNITKETVLSDKSRKAMNYSVSALTKNYLWPYGERGHHKFIDNFHTGFNLVALKNWIDFTGENGWEDLLKKAYHQYLTTFWREDGCPKYYHNSLYPIDIHSSAQGIVTCLILSVYADHSLKMARKIAEWAIFNMQDINGYFYYQKTRWYTNKIPYIRWSQAWMFYALSYYLHVDERNLDKLGYHRNQED